MVPPRGCRWRPPAPAPRTREDGPEGLETALGPSACSPYARGWSRVPAGRLPLQALLPVRGPRARGWTLEQDRQRVRHRLLPVRAGMSPTARGVGPQVSTASRARGDGPHSWPNCGRVRNCSPRLRDSPSGVGAEAGFGGGAVSVLRSLGSLLSVVVVSGHCGRSSLSSPCSGVLTTGLTMSGVTHQGAHHRTHHGWFSGPPSTVNSVTSDHNARSPAHHDHRQQRPKRPKNRHSTTTKPGFSTHTRR